MNSTQVVIGEKLNMKVSVLLGYYRSFWIALVWAVAGVNKVSEGMSTMSLMVLYIITSCSLVLLDSSVSQFRYYSISVRTVTLLVLWYLLVHLCTISSSCFD